TDPPPPPKPPKPSKLVRLELSTPNSTMTLSSMQTTLKDDKIDRVRHFSFSGGDLTGRVELREDFGQISASAVPQPAGHSVYRVRKTYEFMRDLIKGNSTLTIHEDEGDAAPSTYKFVQSPSPWNLEREFTQLDALQRLQAHFKVDLTYPAALDVDSQSSIEML